MEETGALTERVEEQLVRLILDNDLQPGDRIPTEPELMERLGVGRNTLCIGKARRARGPAGHYLYG